TSPQFQRTGQHQPAARRTDRMAESDSTTIHVHALIHLVGAQAQSPSARNTDGGECLVYLDQVEVEDADLLLLHSDVDRVCWLKLQGGVGACDARMRTNFGNRVES